MHTKNQLCPTKRLEVAQVQLKNIVLRYTALLHCVAYFLADSGLTELDYHSLVKCKVLGRSSRS